MMKTILLIEDDLDISDVTNLFLTSRGFKVVHHFGIDDYDKYLAIIKEVRPNVILSDIYLPGIDGRKLCQFVKEDSQLLHIPYILYSAGRFTKDAQASLPGEYFLPKPFSLDKLEATITEAIDSSEQVRASEAA